MDLTKLKARELISGYENRDFTVEEVTKAYIEKIKDHNNKYNTYITFSEEKALSAAKKVDKHYQDREEMGILSGVPISVKDNIAVKDMRMTCASKMLEDFIPHYESTVEKKIRKNCGVILGKVNMDEFAMGASTKTSYFGPSKNPLNPDLVPGGSSGGSAASLAAEECALSVGTDTGGSIRQPASFCGLVGIKPTYGSISRFGVASMANTFDQVGAFGKDVADAHLLLKALEGRSKKDATSVGNKSLKFDLAYDNDDEAISYLKGLNIAIPKMYLDLDLDPRVKEEYEKAIEIFEKNGANINVVEIDALKYVVQTYNILVNGEIAPNMARFDGLRYGHRTDNYSSYEEMFKKSRAEGFGTEVKRRIMIGTHILSLDYAKDYYYKALEVRNLIKTQMDKVFESNNLMLCTTSPILPPRIDKEVSPVEMYKQDLFTIPANMIGGPSMSVPMPKKDGLSVGMELTANRFKDDLMIKAALGFERSMR